MKTKILEECLLNLKVKYLREYKNLQKAKSGYPPVEVKKIDLIKGDLNLSGLFNLRDYLEEILKKTHQEKIDLKDFFLSKKAQKRIKYFINISIDPKRSSLLKWLTIDNKLSNYFIKQLNLISDDKINTKNYFKALKAAQIDFLTNYYNNFNKMVYRYCAKVEPKEDTYIEDQKRKYEESII